MMNTVTFHVLDDGNHEMNLRPMHVVVSLLMDEVKETLSHAQFEYMQQGMKQLLNEVYDSGFNTSVLTHQEYEALGKRQ
jgi:hypothetical protein